MPVAVFVFEQVVAAASVDVDVVVGVVVWIPNFVSAVVVVIVVVDHVLIVKCLALGFDDIELELWTFLLLLLE